MTIEIRPAVPDDVPSLIAIVDAAEAAGAFPGHVLDDVERWRISMREVPAKTLVATVDRAIAGLLCVETHDLVVNPTHRRRGVGRALVARVLADRPDFTLYPGDHHTPGADFLRAVGMVHAHSWFEMVVDADVTPPAVGLPDGIVLRTYQPAEAETFLHVLHTSFADHPTPIEADLDLILRVQARPEFDPTLLGVLVDAAGEWLGFCRCGVTTQPDGVIAGEIRTLGVMPQARRHGYGRLLLRWGVHRLREAGCARVMLGVFATNDKALALYRSEGFVSIGEHPSYAMPAT